MGAEELKNAKAQLIEMRHEVRDRISELKSEVGQRILKRKQEELEAARRQYVTIPVIGQDPHDVAFALVAAQNYEKHLKADIDAMRSPEKTMSGVDRELRLCNDAINAREKSRSVER